MSNLGIESGCQVCSYWRGEHSAAADEQGCCRVNHTMRQVGVAGGQSSADNSHQGSARNQPAGRKNNQFSCCQLWCLSLS